MREKLMERLRLVTQEEQRLLEGGQVERERYSGKPLGPEVLAVDSQRLLDHGELITLRTHTGSPPSRPTPTTTWRSCTCAAARRCTGSTAARP